MMALFLRIALFFFLYQLFRSFLRKPKRLQSHQSARASKPIQGEGRDESIVEAEYRVIKE